MLSVTGNNRFDGSFAGLDRRFRLEKMSAGRAADAGRRHLSVSCGCGRMMAEMMRG